MKRILFFVLLLTGCSPPPVEETLFAGMAMAIAFLIPLIGAAIFSALAAWGLIAAQEARRHAAARPGAVQAAVACLLGGSGFGLLALGNAWMLFSKMSQPEAGPIWWLEWPAPTSPSALVLLGVAALLLLVVGVLGLLAKAPAD